MHVTDGNVLDALNGESTAGVGEKDMLLDGGIASSRSQC